MTNDENRIREIMRAETESTVNIAENMRILSDELNNRISTEMEGLFENLNDRMQRMIEGALNARNSTNCEMKSHGTLGPELENGQNHQVAVAERQGNERAVSGDLYRVQSCADLRPNNTNTENQTLRICIPREDHQQIRAYQSVQNLSTGREDNFNLTGTEGGHQMGSNDDHQMAATTTSQNVGLGSSHHT